MNPFVIAKGAIGLLTTIGSGIIVNNVIKATTPAVTTKFTQVCIGTTGSVLGMIVGQQVTKKVEEQIDAIEAGVEMAKKQVKEKKEKK